MSDLYPEDLQPLHTYDYIPETYKIQWDDYDQFLPKNMTSIFNKKIYYNFLQRECFNSCIQSASSDAISDEERSCFNNCRSKHLASLGIYERVTMAKRKWNGILSFVNLAEFNKKPEEMNKMIPTDPYLTSAMEFNVIVRRNALQSCGLYKLFGHKSNTISPNLFEFYAMGYQVENSNAYVRDFKPQLVTEKVFSKYIDNSPNVHKTDS